MSSFTSLGIPVPERISSDHRLIEEHYQIRRPHLGSAGIDSSFVAVTRPSLMTTQPVDQSGGQLGDQPGGGKQDLAELVTKQTIGDKEYITLVSRDPDSATGWAYHPFIEDGKTHMAVTDLAAFYFEEDLYVFGRSSELSQKDLFIWAARRSKDGVWANITSDIWNTPLPKFAQPFQVSFTADGHPVLFGLFTNKNSQRSSPALNACVLTLHPKTKKWAAIIGGDLMVNKYANVQLASVAIDYDADAIEWHAFVAKGLNNENRTCSTLYYRAPLEHGRVRAVETRDWKPFFVGEQIGLRPRQDAWKVDFFQIIKGKLLYYYAGAGNEFAHTETMGRTGEPLRITQASYTEIDGTATIVALDGDDSLWICRFTDWREGRFRDWTWSQVGDRFRTLAVAPHLYGEIEFFGLSRETPPKLQHMYRSPDTTWTKEEIEEPTEQDQPTVEHSAYVVEINCKTRTGIPCPGVRVSLAANRYTEVICKGVSHHTDARSPTVIFTDELGIARFSVRATSLMAPVFKVTVATLMGDRFLTVRPDIHSYEKLASDEMNAETIKELADDAYGPKAGEIATSVKKAARLALKPRDADGGLGALAAYDWLHETPYAHGLDVHHVDAHDSYQCAPEHSNDHDSWALDFHPDGAVSHTVLTGAQASAMASEIDTSATVPWKSIGDFFRWAGSQVAKITRFVVEVTAQGYKLMIKVGEQIWGALVETVQQIGGFIELIFTKIAKEIGKAKDAMLNWLKEVFGWGDILRTKEVFSHLVLQQIDLLETNLQRGQTLIDTKFEEFRNQLTGVLDSAIKELEGKSMRGLAGDTPGYPGIGDDPLKPAALSRTSASRKVQGNYINDMRDSNDPKSSASQMALMAQGSLLDDLKKLSDTFINEDLPRFADQIKGLIDHFAGMADDPEKFFEMALSGILRVLKLVVDGVLTVARHVVNALFSIIIQIVKSIRSVLTAEIEIPVLTRFYAEMTKTDEQPEGAKLTLLDMFTLGLACPVTIVFKVAGIGRMLRRTEAAPFTAAETRQVKAWQAPFPNIFGTDAEQPRAPRPLPLTVKATLAVTQIVFEVPIDFVKAGVDRAGNEIPGATPMTPPEIKAAQGLMIFDAIVFILNTPVEDITNFDRDPFAAFSSINWVIGGMATGFSGLPGAVGFKYAHASSVNGGIGVLIGVVDFGFTVAKMESGKSVYDVLGTAAAAPKMFLPLFTQDLKIDPYFIMFGAGRAISATLILASSGLSLGDAIWTAHNPSSAAGSVS